MRLARVAREVVEDVLAVPLDEHLLHRPDHRALMQAQHLRSLVRRLAEGGRAGAVPGGGAGWSGSGATPNEDGIPSPRWRRSAGARPARFTGSTMRCGAGAPGRRIRSGMRM